MREWTIEEAIETFGFDPEEAFPDLEAWYVEGNVLCVVTPKPEDTNGYEELSPNRFDNYIESLEDDDEEDMLVHRYSAI
jgi:hypothetical protein